MKDCPTCEGSGGLERHRSLWRECPDCMGMGKYETQNWYFTFGQSHCATLLVDGAYQEVALAQRYVKINDTQECAKVKMMTRFGIKWANQYDEATFLPQITKYNLTELE